MKGCKELAIDAIAGYGYDWYDISRQAGSTQASVVAGGSPTGMEYDFLLGFEYLFSTNKFEAFPEGLHLTPNANVQYIGTDVGSYSEKNGGVYSLAVQQQHANSLRSNLGARLDYLVCGDSVTFKPEFELAWQYEYLDSTRTRQEQLDFQRSN